MKKFTSVLFGLTICGLPLMAAETTPTFFSENFVRMNLEHKGLTADWTTYGNGAEVAENVAPFFQNGDDYILMGYGDKCIAMTSTNFTPSTPADQWLITPAIEVPADDMELSFTAAIYNMSQQIGSGSTSFKVLISETGVEQEDFTEIKVSGNTVKPSLSKEVTMKNYFVPLSGYQGKTIHVAFVVDSENTGLTGFTNIALGNYAISFQNTTVEVVELGESAPIQVNVGMKTPVKCAGFTATLKLSNGAEPVQKTYKKNLGGAGTSYAYQFVEFDPVTFNDAMTVDYTVEIQPDYEGAPVSTLTGSIGVPAIKYPNNVVIEELTATGCGWCPSGTASMKYYSDTYKGSETEGFAIPIAVHGYVNYTDPMSVGMTSYVSGVQSMSGASGYPQAMFNRNSSGASPHSKVEVEKRIGAGSHSQAKISDVVIPEGDDVWGKSMTVYFQTKNAYSSSQRPLRGAVVLLEDNVKGNESGYSQTNYFATRSSQFVKENYGDFLVPYLQDYIMGGELGVEMIPYSKMVYNHVSRLIAPAFEGVLLSEEWNADEFKDFKIEFTIPESIIDIRNTQAVVLILNGNTGEIVASDVRSAADYITTGVAEVGAGSNGVKAYKTAEGVAVEAAEGSIVTLYGADGKVLATVVAQDGTTNVATSARGVVIVKVSGNANGVSKVVL